MNTMHGARSVTLDSSVFPHDELLSCLETAGVHVAVVTVTDREFEGTSFAAHIRHFSRVFETAVCDESRCDESICADGTTANDFEMILSVMTNGSFPQPGQREHLTPGQYHQLRDAMILDAHIRAGHDVLITADRRGFITHRDLFLERLGARIMTPTEVLNSLRR